MLEKRKYQEDCLNALKKKINQGKKKVMLVLPTGAGKTVIFSKITKNCFENDKNVLILVHKKELVQQASDKLTSFDVEHGVIQSGKPWKQCSIQVASVQTLINRLNFMSHFQPDLIIVDEAHHVAPNNTWTKVLNKYPNAITLGVTATPERLDGNNLGFYFEDLVVGVNIPHLVSKGFLAPHVVYAPPNNLNVSKIKTIGGDYNLKQLAEETIQADIVGDAVEQYKAHADGLPAIAFCVSIDHAKITCEKFKKAGYKAAVVDGKMKEKDRDEAIQGLANGSVQVLCSCMIVSEGTDIPEVACAILLRKTKSMGLYMQQVGRILRPQKNKTAIILDHVGNTREHGFVDEPREWSLQCKPRSKRKFEKAPAVQTCKVCFATFRPSKICPACGHEIIPTQRELTEAEGKLEVLQRKFNLKMGDLYLDVEDNRQYVFLCYSDDVKFMPFKIDRDTYAIGATRDALQHLTDKNGMIKESTVIKWIDCGNNPKLHKTSKSKIYPVQNKLNAYNKSENEMFDKQRKDLVNAARTRPELEKVARILGYSDGWVYTILKHRKNARYQRNQERMPEWRKKSEEKKKAKRRARHEANRQANLLKPKAKNNDAWDW